MEDIASKSREELVEEIFRLRMECDVRLAREEALEAQIRNLGQDPVKHTFLDPAWSPEELEEPAIAVGQTARQT